MYILFVSTWFPFPLDNGSRLRVHYLLRTLAEKHAVDLAAFFPPGTERRYLKEAQSLCRQVQVVERDPFYRDPRKSLLGYFSWKPRDVLSGHSPAMAALVRRMAQAERYDLVICSTTEVAPYCVHLAGMPKLLEEHNFMTGWMEERYRAQTHPLKKIARWATWQKCRRYERRLYERFAAVSMVSDADCQAVRQAFPAYHGRLAVIPNGVDLATRQPGLVVPAPDSLVFNGSLNYAANVQAVRFFCRQVLPLVWQQRPQVSLTITGRYDQAELDWLPDDRRITLTGFLEDVRPAVAGSWLAVAPLLDGGGTRLKILEAMALGTPVVATSKGAEGLAVTNGKDILIADDAAGLAAHCLRLLEDASLRQEIAFNARRLVEQRYDWRAIGEQFCQLAEAVAAQAGKPGSK